MDPRNRALWQSSLRRVELLDEDIQVGQRWIDVTAPGFRPAMETTVLDRPRTWTETGRWHGVTAELTLSFRPAGSGCQVAARATVRGAVVGPVLTWLAPSAIRGDLRRAARLLSERPSGQ